MGLLSTAGEEVLKEDCCDEGGGGNFGEGWLGPISSRGRDGEGGVYTADRSRGGDPPVEEEASSCELDIFEFW